MTNTPDNFKAASKLYNKRQRTRDRMNEEFANAPTAVQALVEAQEEADANQAIDSTPTNQAAD